jgi:hypothetical protein
LPRARKALRRSAAAAGPDDGDQDLASDADGLEKAGRGLAAVGLPVEGLVRTDLGDLSLGEQRPGSIRALTRKEIGDLQRAVGL